MDKARETNAFRSFPQPVEIVENSKSQKVKNLTFLVF
jgi:hypothetical protein